MEDVERAVLGSDEAAFGEGETVGAQNPLAAETGRPPGIAIGRVLDAGAGEFEEFDGGQGVGAVGASGAEILDAGAAVIETGDAVVARGAGIDGGVRTFAGIDRVVAAEAGDAVGVERAVQRIVGSRAVDVRHDDAPLPPKLQAYCGGRPGSSGKHLMVEERPAGRVMAADEKQVEVVVCS